MHNGEAIVRTRSFDGSGFDAGNYTVSGNAFVMNLQGYDVDIPGTVNSTLAGTYAVDSSMTGLWSNDDGGSGGFSLVYDDIYERPSSMDTIIGAWSWDEPFRTLAISSDGAFEGGDSSSCYWVGNISVLDVSINLYDVAMTVTGCLDDLYNGNYSGYATLEDELGFNDAMRLLASQDAGSVAIGMKFLRQ